MSAMREAFPGYYKLERAELDSLWESAIVIVDTNVLLDLYQQSPATREEMIQALQFVDQQLWMPHQVGLEFHRRRVTVRNEATSPYRELGSFLDSFVKDLESKLESLTKKHAGLTTTDALTELRSAISKLRSDVGDAKATHVADRKSGRDAVMDAVDGLFTKPHIGKSFTHKQLKKQRREGQRRIDARQPPGYLDGDKPGDGRFGDYFIWIQSIRQARQKKRDVIFVTNDGKDDWMKGTEFRPELTDEFVLRSGQFIQLYTASQFLTEASNRRAQSESERASVEAAAKEIEGIAETKLRLATYKSANSLNANTLENLRLVLANLYENLSANMETFQAARLASILPAQAALVEVANTIALQNNSAINSFAAAAAAAAVASTSEYTGGLSGRPIKDGPEADESPADNPDAPG